MLCFHGKLGQNWELNFIGMIHAIFGQKVTIYTTTRRGKLQKSACVDIWNRELMALKSDIEMQANKCFANDLMNTPVGY